jgi:S-adenosylmethionine decarboxylase
VYQENLFHTKMLLKNFELDNYLFGDATSNLSAEQRAQVTERVKHEMLEIFYARNMPS